MPYFEGWYLKHQCSGRTIAFIPAVHRGEDGKWEVSLQIVTEKGAWYLTYPEEACRICRKPFCVMIGKNIFTDNGVHLDICEEGLKVKGNILYQKTDGLRYDIMGIFKYVPFLQCRHGVLSMCHRLKGILNLNGERISLTGGRGYIETDRGRSFPKSYLWTQCFFGRIDSIMLSVADIPFSLVHFQGCICAIHYRGREYRLATYLGVHIDQYQDGTVAISQGRMKVKITRLSEAGYGLKAPQKGKMSRIIRESPSCQVRYQFWIDKKPVFDFVSKQASFEQTE